jgi:hypothetical protein
VERGRDAGFRAAGGGRRGDEGAFGGEVEMLDDADSLINSLDTEVDEDAEEAWKQEIAQRASSPI